jgi:predicted GNAT family acetyltransferase
VIPDYRRDSVVRTRTRMKILLKNQTVEESYEYRTISQKDAHALGILMLESYKNTLDYEGETLKDAVSEVSATLNGKYGPFLDECSFLIEDTERILSACIVVHSDEVELPLIAYTMTHPGNANQGMATYLIKKSMNALLDHEYKELYLVVTEGNAAARHLYEKVGFTVWD